jgi:hypothetical protein
MIHAAETIAAGLDFTRIDLYSDGKTRSSSARLPLPLIMRMSGTAIFNSTDGLAVGLMPANSSVWVLASKKIIVSSTPPKSA